MTTKTSTSNGHAGEALAPAGPGEQQIKLERLESAMYRVAIIGVTPLIPHKWSEKALRMMREKQSGNKVQPKRDPKVAEEEAEAATYRLADGRPGMPATAFKSAVADAARFFEGLTIVQAKQSFFIKGEGVDQLVPIEGDNYIREDTPRNSTGVVDLRYRRCFPEWSAVLPVTFNPRIIDINSVIALIDAAGNGGVGDWRPSSPKSKSGTYGRFQVNDDLPVEQVR